MSNMVIDVIQLKHLVYPVICCLSKVGQIAKYQNYAYFTKLNIFTYEIDLFFNLMYTYLYHVLQNLPHQYDQPTLYTINDC